MQIKIRKIEASVMRLEVFLEFLILLFIICTGVSNAQIKSSKNIARVYSKAVSLRKNVQMHKNILPIKTIQRALHFKVNAQVINTLKAQKLQAGIFGGNAISDKPKLNEKMKTINKILSPTTSNSFYGISQFADSVPYIPPDPMIASSNNEVLEVANDEMEVFDTSGTSLYYETFQTLFGLPDYTFITDPKVVYDQQSGRFVMLALQIDWGLGKSYYLLAVSSDSADPGGSFYLYSLDASTDGVNPTSNYADFPGLGLDSLSIYITSNQYDFSTDDFQYAKLRVVNKSLLYSGTSANYTDFWGMRNADNSLVFTLKPALIIGSSQSEFLINTDPDGNNYVSTWQVKYDVSGNPSIQFGSTIDIGAYKVPPDAGQIGTTSLISTGDCRTQDVVWKDNELYTAFTEGYNWGNGEVSALRILKINTSTWTADRNINYGADNVDYFYPAVTPDNSDKMYLTFNTSSAEQLVDMRAAAEIWNDPSSTLIYQSYSSYDEPRWGDYSGISLSPTGTIWAVTEVADFGNYWNTFISGLSNYTGSNNSYIILSDTVVDFIGTSIGNSSVFNLDIQNPDYANVNLVGTASILNGHFSFVGESSFNLPPGQDIKLKIQYNAVAQGFITDSLVINSNSSNYPSTFKLAINALGVTPTIRHKRIKFDIANDYYGQSDTTYFESFIRLLRAKGDIIDLSDSTFDLRGYDYFISVTPMQDYTQDQINTIQSFVNGGGGLIILPYYNYYPGSQFQNNLLSALKTGISINNKLVEDTTEEISNNPVWFKLFTMNHPNDPVVSGIDTLGAFHTTSLIVNAPADSLVVTSPNAFDYYLKLNASNGIYSRNSEVLQGNNKSDEILNTSGIASTIPVIAESNIGLGKVIVLGTEEFFQESDYSPVDILNPPYYFPGIRYYSNRILALNLFDTQTGPSVVKIVSVNDVPNDAGKQLRITWENEFASGPTPIISYAIWRYDSSWTFINQVPATYDSIYSAIVPTLSDSNMNGTNYEIYRVTAITRDNKVFTSEIDSGYSINNLRITSVPTPSITTISDVPNDQGHMVYLSWKLNKSATASGISKFAVWRKDSAWVYINDVTATSDSSYTVVVPTIFDSTIFNGIHYSTFKVSSHSSDPSVFAMSLPDSGYSVDNLRPQTPDSLQVLASQQAIVLGWSKSVDKDFLYFEVYRDSTDKLDLTNDKPIAYVTSNSFVDSKIVDGKPYYYWVAAVDFSGNQSNLSLPVTAIITAIDNENSIPKNFSLQQNYPNPFNPSTIIEYQLPKSETVRLNVFDILGRDVATLVNTFQSAGSYKVQWNGKNNKGSDLTSGIYFYSIEAGSFRAIKKMIYLK